ncbi:MAG TPA: YcxB family protein [Candidatus Acidoferrales bacterium]
MEVRYTHRIEDFEDITRAVDRLHPRSRRLRQAYILVGVLVVALPFLAAGSIRHPDPTLWPLLPFAACLIAAGAKTPSRRARKYYSKLIFPYEYKVEISDAGITTNSPTVRTELQWRAFSSVIAGKDVLALTYEGLMYLFPRRAFTDDQWTDFMRLIREHVPQST